MSKLGDIAFGACAGLGLGLSGLLLYEYTSTAAVCGPDGGCSVVRASSYASIGGVPTPLYGVVFFVVAAGLRVAGARRALPIWLAGGALAALGFIGVQLFALKTICAFCMVVDLSALGLFATWALTSRKHRETGRPMPVSAAIFAVIPFALGFAMADREDPAPMSGDLPGPVAAEQRRGVVTVVEFLDFQCPHCRLLHGELKNAIAAFPGPVRVVRKNVPISRHEHAIGAALASICAEAQNRGDELADAMLVADDVGPEARELLAEKAGVDMTAWRDCLDSDFAKKRLEADLADAQAVGVRSLPTYYIGDQRFKGARRADELRQALDQAAREGLGPR